MMFILAIGIAGLIYYVFRENSRGEYRGDKRSPEEILREKLARGEIDEETYERRMEIIRK